MGGTSSPRSSHNEDRRPEERQPESSPYGIHSSFVTSLAAKYKSEDALGGLGRSSRAAKEKRYKPPDRYSMDWRKNKGVVSTPPPMRFTEDTPLSSPVRGRRPIRFGEESY